MRRALELGRQHQPHPNPRVGAVLVDGKGRVVGEGAHRSPGTEHAEAIALRAAGDAASGATLYVTLEPCAHQGSTPPCVDAIVGAGIARVVVGAEDPDPRVAGAGITRLRQAGVAVTEGVLADEARAMDPAYFHHRKTRMPMVTMKYAMTLDGSIAAADGSSRWITSAEARDDAHMLRAENDAVVVGAGTIRRDDPLLTVRLEGFQGRQPVPVIVAGKEDLPREAAVWGREPVVVSATERAIPAGRLLVVGGEESLPDPVESARALGDLGHLGVLVEGGARLSGAWWSAGVVTRGVAYLGAKIGGGKGTGPLEGIFERIGDATEVMVSDVRSLGPDLRITFQRSASVHRDR